MPGRFSHVSILLLERDGPPVARTPISWASGLNSPLDCCAAGFQLASVRSKLGIELLEKAFYELRAEAF
jgi:hypothetical protein